MIDYGKCPRCQSTLQRRTGSRGPFVSCTGYPECRFSRNLKSNEKEEVEEEHAEPEVPRHRSLPLEFPAAPPLLGVPNGALAVPAWMVPAPTITLNAPQQRVCDHRQGWAACIASAGSGKTTILVERTSQLVREGTIPEAILLLAFNREARATLRGRIVGRLGDDAGSRVQIFTFHAFCYAILRYWFPRAPNLAGNRIIGTERGPKPAPIVYEAARAAGITRDIDWTEWQGYAEVSAESLIDVSTQNADLQLMQALGRLRRDAGDIPDYMRDEADAVTRFCQEYRRIKSQDNLIDFADMLYIVAFSIMVCQAVDNSQQESTYPHVLHMQRMYSDVMVDECQDGNRARWIISKWLANQARSLVCVGDPRQAITASFTGADPSLFMEFLGVDGESEPRSNDRPVDVFTLPINLRSSQRIVAASNDIAHDQSWNMGGACTHRDGAPQGDPIQVWDTLSPREEADRIALDVQRRVAEWGGPEATRQRLVQPFACLARTNSQLVDLECGLLARGVAVEVRGQPGGVWGSTVGRDVLAYLKGAEGHPDWGILDIANKPKRFISRKAIAEVIHACRESKKEGELAPLHLALSASPVPGLQRLGRDFADLARKGWGDRVERVVALLRKTLGAREEALTSSELDRWEAYEALGRYAIEAGSLDGIEVWRRAAAREKPMVLLSTIHKAKGLEWPVVYVCGVCANKLPHKRADDLDEELRLFYVACTRARDTLVISPAGALSPFLEELRWGSEVAPGEGSLRGVNLASLRLPTLEGR